MSNQGNNHQEPNIYESLQNEMKDGFNQNYQEGLYNGQPYSSVNDNFSLLSSILFWLMPIPTTLFNLVAACLLSSK